MDGAGLLAAKQLQSLTFTVTLGEGETADIRLSALPRKAYRELVEAHPAADDSLKWDQDTFPPALIAASCVEPKLTKKQAQKIWDTWEEGEASRLFLACFQLNENPAGVGFTWPGSAKTRGSGRKSNTATRKA